MLPIIVHEIALGVRRWNDRRIAARELAALNDHFLRDIGIERHQIRRAVAEVHAMPAAPEEGRESGRATDAEVPNLPGWPAGFRSG